MGRVAAPYGVKGWLKVQPMTAEPETLLAHPQWWLRRRGGEWQAFTLEEGRMHGRTLVVKLAVIADREAAAVFAGGDAGVPRSALPAAGEDQVYWADLVGLEVWNRQGESLGRVSAVRDYGAHPVLELHSGEGVRLVPFVEAYVDRVDVAGGRIEVDWGRDF